MRMANHRFTSTFYLTLLFSLLWFILVRLMMFISPPSSTTPRTQRKAAPPERRRRGKAAPPTKEKDKAKLRKNMQEHGNTIEGMPSWDQVTAAPTQYKPLTKEQREHVAHKWQLVHKQVEVDRTPPSPQTTKNAASLHN